MKHSIKIAVVLIILVLITGALFLKESRDKESRDKEPDDFGVVDVSVIIEDDGSELNQLKIIPETPINFFPKPSFTLKQVILEVKKEFSANGESNRYNYLLELGKKIELELEKLDTPEGGRKKRDHITGKISRVKFIN